MVTPEWASWFDSGMGGDALPTIVQREIRNVFVQSTTPGAQPAPMVTWASLDKTGSSLADLQTRAASDLTGPLPWANLPSGAGRWAANPIIGGALVVEGGLVVGADALEPAVTDTVSLGRSTRRWLDVHASQLSVQTIVSRQVSATVSGAVLVAVTSALANDLPAGATMMSVKHNAFAANDIVRLEARGRIEWVKVTGAALGPGPYDYPVQRALVGVAAAWLSGDAVVNTGQVGTGIIDIHAQNGILFGQGPGIVGLVRTGLVYNNLAPRWAIGELNGLYGYTVSTFGVAMGDPSAGWLKVDATNGLRIGHNLTTHATLSANGLEFGAGQVILSNVGLYINPVSAGGGGAYSNTNAVRWTTDLTYHNAIWRSDDAGFSPVKDWRFDHFAGTDTIFARTYIETKKDVLGGGSNASLFRQWSNDNGRAETLIYSKGTPMGTSYGGFLYLWGGSNPSEAQAMIGSGVPTQGPSGGPPSGLTGGFYIIGAAVYLTGVLRTNNVTFVPGHFYDISDYQLGVGKNLEWNGSSWNLIQTSESGWSLRFVTTTQGDFCDFVHATPGVNPRTVTTPVRVTPAGLVMANNVPFQSFNTGGTAVNLAYLDTNNVPRYGLTAIGIGIPTMATPPALGNAALNGTIFIDTTSLGVPVFVWYVGGVRYYTTGGTY